MLISLKLIAGKYGFISHDCATFIEFHNLEVVQDRRGLGLLRRANVTYEFPLAGAVTVGLYRQKVVGHSVPDVFGVAAFLRVLKRFLEIHEFLLN
jgi:hypothetical protein